MTEEMNCEELSLLAYAVPALEPRGKRQSPEVCAKMFAELIRFVRETASTINRRQEPPDRVVQEVSERKPPRPQKKRDDVS